MTLNPSTKNITDIIEIDLPDKINFKKEKLVILEAFRPIGESRVMCVICMTDKKKKWLKRYNILRVCAMAA